MIKLKKKKEKNIRYNEKYITLTLCWYKHIQIKVILWVGTIGLLIRLNDFYCELTILNNTTIINK